MFTLVLRRKRRKIQVEQGRNRSNMGGGRGGRVGCGTGGTRDMKCRSEEQERRRRTVGRRRRGMRLNKEEERR